MVFAQTLSKAIFSSCNGMSFSFINCLKSVSVFKSLQRWTKTLWQFMRYQSFNEKTCFVDVRASFLNFVPERVCQLSWKLQRIVHTKTIIYKFCLAVYANLAKMQRFCDILILYFRLAGMFCEIAVNQLDNWLEDEVEKEEKIVVGGRTYVTETLTIILIRSGLRHDHVHRKGFHAGNCVKPSVFLKFLYLRIELKRFFKFASNCIV